MRVAVRDACGDRPWFRGCAWTTLESGSERCLTRAGFPAAGAWERGPMVLSAGAPCAWVPMGFFTTPVFSMGFAVGLSTTSSVPAACGRESRWGMTVVSRVYAVGFPSSRAARVCSVQVRVVEVAA